MIYVTTMYRYGDRESHSYVRYAGRTLRKAVKIGRDEYYYRGGKYYPEVVEVRGGKVINTVYSELDDNCIRDINLIKE